MSRVEFKPKIKLLRWDFAQGHCECCHCRIIGGAHYDHDIPFEISQDSSFDNCRCICPKCHRLKTSTKDMPDIAKAKRRERKFKGITRSKYKWPKRPFTRAGLQRGQQVRRLFTASSRCTFQGVENDG